MNFEKAFKELMAGKKIRRKEWEKLRYLQIKNGEVTAYQGEYTHFYQNSGVLISDGWRVVDGDGTSMTFMEAIEELRNKKCITCDEMGEGFLFVESGHLTLCKPVEFVFMPSWTCLNSQDWEVSK